MPDLRVSALTAGTVLASNDEFVVVDKSDTAMAASGTDKRYTVATIAADPVLLAALEVALDLRYAQIAPAWTAWTPTATASGGGLGFGTTGKIQAGRYEQIGKTVRGWFNVTLGTGASPGTGVWLFALPVPPNTTNTRAIGSGFIFDLSGTDVRTHCSLILVAGAATAQIRPHGQTANVADSVPWTWAALDGLEFQFQYEAA